MYNIYNKIGEGIIGKVYLATNEEGHKLAIKIIPPHSLVDFKSEATILKKLKKDSKEYVLCYEDSFQAEDGTYYFVTEYLDDYITLSNVVSDGLNEEDQKTIVKEMIQGLEYLHSKGVGHGDINLDNIMLNPFTMKVKYIDFGFSCEDCKDIEKQDFQQLSSYIYSILTPLRGYYKFKGNEEKIKEEEEKAQKIVDSFSPLNMGEYDLYPNIQMMQKDGIAGLYDTRK